MSIIKPSYSTGYAKNASQSAHPNLWDGLVGAWMPSLGVTGNTLKDVSGNGNDGTLTFMDAATDWVGTSKGLAINFDRATNYVTTPFRTNYGSTFCYSVWYRSSSSLNQNLIGSYQSGRSAFNFDINYSQSSGSPLAGYISGFAQYGTNRHRFSNTNALSLSDGEWHHVAIFVRTGVNAGIYFDGKEIPVRVYQANSGSFNDPALDIWLGAPNVSGSTNGAGLLGDLGHVCIYDRILSPSEIKQLYVDSLAPFRTKKRTVVRVPAAVAAATVVGSIKKPTTIIKPSYQAGYARNASESENPKLWDGLVGAWMPSLGVTGETLRDVSGNGNNGTLTNMDAATDWVTTSKGKALYFDNNVHKVDYNTNFEPAFDGSYTFSCLVNFFAADDRDTLFGNYDAGSSWLNFERHTINRLRHVVRFTSSSFVDDYTNINVVSYGWNYINFTRQRLSSTQSKLIYHVNGREVRNATVTYLDRTITNPDFYLGADTRNIFTNLNGQIAWASIYNRALSPQEIKQLYVDSLAPFRKKQRVSVAVPAATPTPSATYHPLRSLAHPLEQ